MLVIITGIGIDVEFKKNERYRKDPPAPLVQSFALGFDGTVSTLRSRPSGRQHSFGPGMWGPRIAGRADAPRAAGAPGPATIPGLSAVRWCE
jgi:hypothetical protein